VGERRITGSKTPLGRELDVWSKWWSVRGELWEERDTGEKKGGADQIIERVGISGAGKPIALG